MVCKDLAARPASSSTKGTVRYTTTQLRINQNIYSAALLRAAAIERWLNGDILDRDLCGGALGASAFGPGITTGAASALTTLSAPSPRSLKIRKLTTKSGVRFALSLGQVKINRRIALALKNRALALEARMDGKLTGGDLAANTLSLRALNNGLRVISATPGTPSAPSKTVIKKLAKAPKVTASAKSMRDNQRLGSDAIRILNRLRDQINSGLTDEQFGAATITAEGIDPSIVG